MTEEEKTIAHSTFYREIQAPNDPTVSIAIIITVFLIAVAIITTLFSLHAFRKETPVFQIQETLRESR